MIFEGQEVRTLFIFWTYAFYNIMNDIEKGTEKFIPKIVRLGSSTSIRVHPIRVYQSRYINFENRCSTVLTQAGRLR